MRQRQVKKILKKQGKLNQDPTTLEAWNALWIAVNRDPLWSKSTNCLFIGSRIADGKAYGRLHDASNNELISTETITSDQHFRNLGLK
ncbi:hypothetical protein D3C76_855490 [compost metagenome]